MTGPVNPCPWCGTDCADIDMTTVRGEHVDWFWRQLADVGDRLGDPDLITGKAAVRAPADATERAAAIGLLGGKAPTSGQRVPIDLAALTHRLQAHHPAMTPGMVAAHSAQRSLGERHRSNSRRRDLFDHLERHTAAAFAGIPPAARLRPHIHTIWPVLQRSGWLTRLAALDDPTAVIDQVAAVIAALPAHGERRDRRRLAEAVTRNPHALDSGTLPGLVLAVLSAAGAIEPRLSARNAWAGVNIDCDDTVGGLLALGIYPQGWSLPTGTTVTIPPRELGRCNWPQPDHPGEVVFVTENPSVVTAAADRMAQAAGTQRAVRLLCTVGTPSAGEIDAMGRLARSGWSLAVRADFDMAGLRHVAAMLDGIPQARPWRMSVADYTASLADTPSTDRVLLSDRILPATPWDPGLHQAMSERGFAAYEETLMEQLLADLFAGR